MTVEISHVSAWYGDVVAVNDITMTLAPGVTGLLGPNGAGKTTLLHMVAGFLPPSRGSIRWPACRRGATRSCTGTSVWSPRRRLCTGS